MSIAKRHDILEYDTQSKIRKAIYRSDMHVNFELCGHSGCSRVLYLQIKPHLLSTVLLSEFQSSPEALNLPSKAVLGKFHGIVGHSKHTSLQDRAKFHRSRAWKIS